MKNPFCTPNGEGSREKNSKEPSIRDFECLLLRDEARRRAEVVVGVRDIVRVELDLVVEEEVRSAAELTIAVSGKLIARAIEIELFPTGEPFRMNPNNRADGNAGKAVLVSHEDLAGATNRTSAVPFAELGSNDQDVTLLRFGDLLHHLLRSRGDLEVGRIDLAVAPIREQA